MKASRFLTAPIFSLFDFKIYKEVVSLSVGKSFLYLLYLSALFTIALFLFGWVNMYKANNFVDWLKQNASGITLTQDGMTLDESGRRELIHPQYGPVAVFDDTKEVIQTDEMGSYRLYMTSKMIYINRNGDIQGSPIGSSAQKEFTAYINPETIQKLYDRIKGPVIFAVLFITLIAGFFVRMFVALLLSLFGLMIQTFLPRNLEFSQLYNLASFALSAALVFSIFQLLPILSILSVGLLGVLLSPTYFVIAMIVQPKPAQEIKD